MSKSGKILDYSQSVCDSSFGPDTDFIGPKHTPFFSRESWCPYCQSHVPKILDKSAKWKPKDNDDPCLEEYYWTRVWSCQSCGWWDVYNNESSGHDSVDPSHSREEIRHGVLRTYDISQSEIPINTLREVLQKRGDDILNIHSKVMEELVASVLRDHFPNCVARVCGKTGDRGIDLVVIEADRTIAVQVKRRSRPYAVERVMQIREFLGASLVEGFDHLIYVSTADHYTDGETGAVRFAKDAVGRRIVRSFDLIDRDRFLGMLNLIPRKSKEPWRRYVPKIILTGEQ